MFGKVFVIIQLLLKLFGAWEAFLDWMDTSFSKELEERRQRREEAIAEVDKAESDEDIFDAQEKVIENKP